MKTKYLYLLLALALFFAEHLRAEQQAIGSWSVGINLGYGQRTAFILEQDDLQFYVLPDISYYGEKVFFDNGTLGYTFSETQQFAFSAITEFNPYGMYFEDTPLGESFEGLYVLTTYSEQISDPLHSEQNYYNADYAIVSESDDSVQNINQEVPSSLTLINNPKLSLDVGIQMNWFYQNQALTFKWLKDLTLGNNAVRARLQWAYGITANNLSIQFGVGLDWLNSTASNYYFAADNQHPAFDFGNELSSSVNGFANITASYPLTQNLNVIAHLKYYKFDNNLNESSLLSESHTITRFVGFNYRF